MVEFSDNGRRDVVEVSQQVAQASSQTRELEDRLRSLSQLSDGFARSFTRAFESALIRGEKLDKVLAKLALSLAKTALSAAQKPVEGFLSNIFQSVLSGGVQAFAKGGVISSPTAFPLSGGVGLAGEAGPEAIVPLVRGAGGKLGVASTGGGAVTVNFNVTATDAESFVRSETQVAAMLNRLVSRGNRNL